MGYRLIAGALVLIWLGVLFALTGCQQHAPEPQSVQPAPPKEAVGVGWPGELDSSEAFIAETRTKLARLRKLLQKQQAHWLVLQKPENVCWVLGGSYDPWQHPVPGVAVLIGRYSVHLMAPSLFPQAAFTRLQQARFKVHSYDWREGTDEDAIARRVAQIAPSGKLLSDSAGQGQLVASQVLAAHLPLTAQEEAKYRWLGKACNFAMVEAARGSLQGSTEASVAGRLYRNLQLAGAYPLRIEVLADEHAYTGVAGQLASKVLEHFYIARLAAERWGLRAQVARTISLGKAPGELINNYENCTSLLGSLLAALQPGATLSSCYEAVTQEGEVTGLVGGLEFESLGGITGCYATPFFELTSPESQLALEPPVALVISANSGAAHLAETVLLTSAGPKLITFTGKQWPGEGSESADGSFILPKLLELPGSSQLAPFLHNQ